MQESSGEGPTFGMRPGGEVVPPRTALLGSVSPDGRRAVALTYSDRSVVEVGIMTGARYETLVRGRWLVGSERFAWSNDGGRLAYALPDGSPGGSVQVWSLDTDTGETTLLTPDPGFYWFLNWTATGGILAVKPDGVELLGGGRQPVPLPEAGEVVDAESSPDGRAVAIRLGEYEQNEENELTYIRSGGIWVLGAVAWREVADFANRPPEAQTTGGNKMLWSPDGSRISVHTTRMDGGVVVEGLSVFDAQTGEETRVHDQGWGWESWSPDGRYLAFMRYHASESGAANELKLGIRGPGDRALAVDAYVRQMAWTRDGRLLVDIPGRLSLLEPETMQINEVHTRDGKTISAFVDAPVWSPGGRYVALSTPADALHRSSLYIVDTETRRADLFLDEAGFWARAWLQE